MNVTQTKDMWHHPAPVNALINGQDIKIVESYMYVGIII